MRPVLALAIAWLLPLGVASADEPVVDAPPVPEPVEPAPTVAMAAPPLATPAPTALGSATESAPPVFAPWSAARLELELELSSDARWVRRPGDDLTELRLERGELGARLAVGPRAAAELRVEAIRSAVEGGALGVDGNSTVLRVKYANLAGDYQLGDVRIGGALGFVPDPWIRTVDEYATTKPLSRSLGERLLGWPSSDLSLLVRAAYGPARLAVAIGNGEGLRFPERNRGKTTTAVLEVVPLHTGTLRTSFAAVARDGSLGVASIRDRRFGGGAAVVSPVLRGGFEVLRVLGLGDRAATAGWAVGGWADVRVVEHVFVAARGATLGFADEGGRLSTFGGALAVEPWRDPAHPLARLRVWIAVDRVTATGAAMPLPGADAGEATTVMLIGSAVVPFTLE